MSIYTKRGRWYGNFRKYEDVGGGQEALIPKGRKTATTDKAVAHKIHAEKIQEYERKRRGKDLLGIEKEATLAPFVKHHLIQKKEAGQVADKQVGTLQRHLDRAIAFFGGGRDLASIGPADVAEWAATLRKLPGRGGNDGLSDQTVRHHLNALSGLYSRAESEGYVRPGYNPVARMEDKPTPTKQEAEFLEVHEAALLLEAARVHEPRRPMSIQKPYPLLATFLLTGGRKSEVLGLEVGDISFDRQTVTFRPNEYRDLKTDKSHRNIRLWPQLEAILREYLHGGETARIGSGLLFRSDRADGEQMIDNVRRLLDTLAAACGWDRKIRTKIFRHTYCAARLQTLEGGRPVGTYQVGQEMGHGGRSMVDRVYGHLGEFPHRSEYVEYRVEQHEARLGDKVAAVRAG